MLTRRRAGLGALLLLLVAMVAGLVAARDGDPSDRASVESVDRTTSTTRRRAVTTTSEGSTTTSAGPPSSEATASSAAAGGGAGRPPTTRSPGTTAASPSPTPPPAPLPAPSGLAVARIRLTPVASASYPIAMAVHPPTGAIWIAQKGGSVCRLQGGACTGTQTVASVSTADLEQGLLGIAFSPAGDRFFTSYTNPAGDTRVDRFAAGSAGAPMGGGTTIYAQDQPYGNHNGGNILFGPDGALYLGLGDGGSAGDPHGYAQDPATDLGKILRMDQDGGADPFISGVRNPWRFSFDRATGDLWVADVGQGSWEEVDLLPAGAQAGRNLGWDCYEGSHPFPPGCTPSGTYVGPIFEYSHAEGCSITGGYVYRGSRIPDLVGAYLFADYCDGELRGLTQAGGQATLERRLGVNPGNVVSFGQDASGELYVLTPSAVFRIDPA